MWSWGPRLVLRAKARQPRQQNLVHCLRPFLLGPVAASGKQVQAPEIGQLSFHGRQQIAEHRQDPIPLPGHEKCRLLDAPPLEPAQKGEVAIVVAVAVQRSAKPGALELSDKEIEIGVAQPRGKRIGIRKPRQQLVADPFLGEPYRGRRVPAPGVIEAPQPPAHVGLEFGLGLPK